MKTTINNALIRTFSPCYNPNKIVKDETEELTVGAWIEKYRNLVNSPEDIFWLICRSEFMNDRDLRLFAVWCARSAYSLCTEEYPIDPLSIAAVDCAERFANGLATESELSAAWSAAWSAELSAAWSAARSAAESAARSAACSAAESAARSAAESAAESAAWSAAKSAARSAAESAACSAAESAACSAACSAAWSAAIDQLLTYFVEP